MIRLVNLIPRIYKLAAREQPVVIILRTKGLCTKYAGTGGALKSGASVMPKNTSKKITPMGWFLLLIPATTFSLGCWQIRRKTWKEKLIKNLDERTKMEPIPLPEDLSALDGMEYQKVRVRGKFLHDKEIVMGPRSFIQPDGEETGGGLFSQRNAGNGYLIVTPFKLSDRDDIILINRGWVPRQKLSLETRVDGQINKEVELTGVVRSGETRPQFSPDHVGGVYLYRDLSKMCAFTGARPVFLDATYESTVPNGPIGGQTRIAMRNDHLSYLITWYSLSAATAFMWYRQFIKRKPF